LRFEFELVFKNLIVAGILADVSIITTTHCLCGCLFVESI
jgi:hypothetical protein